MPLSKGAVLANLNERIVSVIGINKERSCKQREPLPNPIVEQARAIISAICRKYLKRGRIFLSSLFLNVFWD